MFSVVRALFLGVIRKMRGRSYGKWQLSKRKNKFVLLVPIFRVARVVIFWNSFEKWMGRMNVGCVCLYQQTYAKARSYLFPYLGCASQKNCRMLNAKPSRCCWFTGKENWKFVTHHPAFRRYVGGRRWNINELRSWDARAAGLVGSLVMNCR